MQLSRGAQRLLTDIQDLTRRYGRAFKSQTTYAAQIGVDVRTIKRWTRELREAGLATVNQARGCSKTCWKTVEDSTRGTKNVPLDVTLRAENVPLAEPLIGVSPTELREKQVRLPAHPVEKKPPQREEGLMPPEFIRHPAGLVERNPEFEHLQAVLRRALSRIKIADNPDAYIRAIILDERGKLRRQA